MHRTFAILFAALVFSSQVHAIGDMTALLNVQEECSQVGDISFGPGQRWASCQVTRGRWVSTIDLVDMYQAQYCLGGSPGNCEQKALLLFGNRAYTPMAKLMVQRLDPANTEYDDPLVIKNEYGRILTVSARLPDGSRSKQYYLWQAGSWSPIDSQAWLKDLAKRLPAGSTASQVSLPDVDTMSAKAMFSRPAKAACCAAKKGVATVELGLRQGRFLLKKIAIANGHD
jgi:hypothetical protein